MKRQEAGTIISRNPPGANWADHVRERGSWPAKTGTLKGKTEKGGTSSSVHGPVSVKEEGFTGKWEKAPVKKRFRSVGNPARTCVDGEGLGSSKVLRGRRWEKKGTGLLPRGEKTTPKGGGNSQTDL